MRIMLLGVFLGGAVFGSGVNAIAQQDAPTNEQSNFAIEIAIDRAANGVSLRCDEGCAWETLSFSCDPAGEDCVGTVDRYGTPAQ